MVKITLDRNDEGVYVLYRNGEPIYVGKSINVFSRIGTHAKNHEMDFDKVEIYCCSKITYSHLEERLIYLLQPIFNTQNTKRADFEKGLEKRLEETEAFYGSKFLGEKTVENFANWIAEEWEKE